MSSTEQDVIANNAVQILKPNGEPKVVYIFNSKTCDGGAELKDILGNKCVSFFPYCYNHKRGREGAYLSSLTNSGLNTFFYVIKKGKKKKMSVSP